MLERMWGKENTPALLVGVQTGTPTLKSVWRFLRKSGNNIPQDTGISLLGIYPKDAQLYHKDMCSSMFTAALFVIDRTWKQPKCSSTKEWIRKMWYIYTMEYYTAERDNVHLEICKQMDGTRNYHIERGNPDPERQISHVLTHKWLLDIKQRKSAYNSQSREPR